MIQMTLAKTAQIINAQLIGQDQTFTGISTDSRADCSGTLFVALAGENFNAEDFCQQAIDNGAKAVLVSHDLDISVPQLICSNTLQGLTSLSAYWALLCPTKIIAVTGSNGKTTVKNMLKSILSVSHQCYATEGNFNNEIGVPLTLCKISKDDDFAVIEMGAAKLGDISHLMSLVEPTTTILTNASAAHIGRFGNFQNIVEEKGQICALLNKNQHSILPIDDDNYDYWSKHTNAQITSFGVHKNADIRVGLDYNDYELTTYNGVISGIKLPTIGQHNKVNAAAACAAALTVDIDLKDIKNGLQTFTPEKGRLQNMGLIKGNRIINDCYNANLASVKAAVDVLSTYQGPTTLVFGNMKELGDETLSMHQKVGHYCRQNNINHLLTIGEDAKHASITFSQDAHNFNNIESLKNHLLNDWQQYGTILVKGSRSMHLEKLITALINEEKLA